MRNPAAYAASIQIRVLPPGESLFRENAVPGWCFRIEIVLFLEATPNLGRRRVSGGVARRFQ